VAAVEDSCEVATITERHACGLRAEPGDAPSMAEAIRSFHADRAMTALYGQHAREVGLSFDRKLQVGRYLDLFREVALGSQP
jgi:hypothetical protein